MRRILKPVLNKFYDGRSIGEHLQYYCTPHRAMKEFFHTSRKSKIHPVNLTLDLTHVLLLSNEYNALNFLHTFARCN